MDNLVIMEKYIKSEGKTFVLCRMDKKEKTKNMSLLSPLSLIYKLNN